MPFVYVSVSYALQEVYLFFDNGQLKLLNCSTFSPKACCCKALSIWFKSGLFAATFDEGDFLLIQKVDRVSCCGRRSSDLLQNPSQITSRSNIRKQTSSKNVISVVLAIKLLNESVKLFSIYETVKTKFDIIIQEYETVSVLLGYPVKNCGQRCRPMLEVLEKKWKIAL